MSYELDYGMLALAHKVAGEQESPYVAAFDEIFVGRENIEKKLISAAKRDGKPGNDIEPLIASRSWQDLAATLIYDRQITEKLFEVSAPNFTASFHRMIIHAIDRLQNNYFLELTGPTSYTINPQPQRLSKSTASLSERGLSWLGGLLPGYTQNKPSSEKEQAPLISGSKASGILRTKLD